MIDNLRLFDLVRYMRAELHQDDLISDGEYAWLCGCPEAKDSVKRLENYDDIVANFKKKLEELAAK